MKRWGFKYISLYFFRSIELNKLRQCSSNYTFLGPILDLGCGDGIFTKQFFGEGRNIIGIDNSPSELSKNKCNTQIILVDACNMPFENESFNTVFSNCVIEHIPNLTQLLNEVSRVLKKDGLFVFTVPSDNFKYYLLPFGGWYKEMRNRRLNHYHCYSHLMWREKLREKGIKVVEYEYYLPKKALQLWDFLALTTFHFWWITFPFAELLYAKVERGIKKYSEERCIDGTALVVIAKKI